MLLPARVKYRKLHRGRRTGVATQGNDLAFGEFGLQASQAAWMTNRQIEAARRVMTRYTRRGGQVLIRIFPDKSVPKKPAQPPPGRHQRRRRLRPSRPLPRRVRNEDERSPGPLDARPAEEAQGLPPGALQPALSDGDRPAAEPPANPAHPPQPGADPDRDLFER